MKTESEISAREIERLEKPIVFVVPWFGATGGGAEAYAYRLAITLRDEGQAVEFWTTRCRDAFTNWREEIFPEGESEVDGLKVRRFRLTETPVENFYRFQTDVELGRVLTPEEEEAGLECSLRSLAMESALREAGDSAEFVFLPYLFGLTYFGLKARGGRGFLMPCLHDEPLAYLNCFRELYSRVRGMLFLSLPEQRLATRLYGLSDMPKTILGGGARTRPGDAEKFREARGIREPFLLYLGRQVEGKGIGRLLEFFARHHLMQPQSQLKLVIIGPGSYPLPEVGREHILDLGVVEEEEKFGALAACLALAQPSPNESLSLALLEAWGQGRPALVNAHCTVTSHFAYASGGAIPYATATEFFNALDKLIAQPEWGADLGRNGRNYLVKNFSWTSAASKLQQFLISQDRNSSPARR
ncbi:MAG: glycosyltransferase family 4 protein [bacterium]